MHPHDLQPEFCPSLKRGHSKWSWHCWSWMVVQSDRSTSPHVLRAFEGGHWWGRLAHPLQLMVRGVDPSISSLWNVLVVENSDVLYFAKQNSDWFGIANLCHCSYNLHKSECFRHESAIYWIITIEIAWNLRICIFCLWSSLQAQVSSRIESVWKIKM